MTGLVDTGAQVTTVKLSWFENNLAGKVSTYRFSLALNAANGEPLPTVGCFNCTVRVGDHTLETVVIITKDQVGSNQPDCLLGTNVLGKIPQFVPRVSRVFQKSSVIKSSSAAVVPARSVLNVAVGPLAISSSALLLAEPAAIPPVSGLCMLPSLPGISSGSIRVPVLNNTDEDLVLPARSNLGTLAQAYSECVIEDDGAALPPVTVSSISSDGPVVGEVEADISRLTSNQDLSDGDAALLRELLREFHDCFAWKDLDLGCTTLIKHRIHLLQDTPISQRYRRLPPSCLDEVRNHLNDLLDRGIITPSMSPWASPVVVVRKKSGELRLCVDYRAVNAISRRDSFPLPRIDEALDALHGSTFFSSLDLASGYYQIPMQEEDKAITAFTCPFGLYEFQRMPFGLCGAPATCQRLMNSVMSDFIFSCLLVYLDDLLVYSKTFANHLLSLRQVLGKLRSVGLKLNPDKCQFAQSSLKFLGHVVSKEGIDTDPDKVAAIRDWGQPTTVSELRSFLGLASYYRRFVPNFSRIARPLNMLSGEVHGRFPDDKDKGEKKPLGDLWTPACEAAFNSLKSHLMAEDTVLTHPDFTKPFVVEVDASLEGIGAILSQDGRPIVYASRSLRGSERAMKNYSSFKLELLGLKWAIADKFRPYLLGSHFTVYTDNSALVHLHKAKLAAVEMRWVAEVTSVGSMTIRHKAGKTNRNADACSRYPVGQPEGPDQEVTAVSCVQVSDRDKTVSYIANDTDPASDLLPTLVPSTVASAYAITPAAAPSAPVTDVLSDLQWSSIQDTDPDLVIIKHWVSSTKKSTRSDKTVLSAGGAALWRHRQQLVVEDGVLIRLCNAPLSTTTSRLPVVPPAHRQELLTRAHDAFFHHGFDRTYSTLRQRVYWPGLRDDVEEYIRRCPRCQTSKAGQAVPQPPGQLRASQPLEILALDFLKVDEASNGWQYILVLTDVFSRYSLAYPCRDQTATTVVTKLLEHWFPYFGVPMRLHSDQGRQFEGKVLQELCRLFNIKKSSTTPYHPQGNGMVERFNGTLVRILRTLEPRDKQRWPSLLPTLCFSYNATPNAVTGLPPFQLLFGREPRTPLDVYLGRQPPDSPGEDYILRHCERIHRLRQQVEAGQPLRPGDLVLERNHTASKLDARFKPAIGKVIKVPNQEGQGPVIVEFPDGERHLHSQHLKRVPPPRPDTPPTAEAPIPASRPPRSCPRVSAPAPPSQPALLPPVLPTTRKSNRQTRPPRRSPDENYVF